MSLIGTYASTYKPFTPSYLIPEPNESLTWDWMEVVSQFTQRFSKIATYVGTGTWQGYMTFDYSALGCDYFPPILKAYIYDRGAWRQFAQMEPHTSAAYGNSKRNYAQFTNIGLATCRFYDGVVGLRGTQNIYHAWQLIAYM